MGRQGLTVVFLLLLLAVIGNTWCIQTLMHRLDAVESRLPCEPAQPDANGIVRIPAHSCVDFQVDGAHID